MNTLLEIALSAAYIGLFVFLIGKWRFFRIGNIPVRWFQAVFLLKVLSGFCLFLIYTYYYTDRLTADIFKYFDDGLVLHSALREHPVDYLRMLFGVLNDTPHFDRYYGEMGHWYRPYGNSLSNDTHTIIRFNAAVRLISFGFYNVHNVWVNFLGLVGLTGIFHFLRQMAPKREKWLFAGVFLMPSVMFWGSGVLKEPLLFFGLGLFLFGTMQLMEKGFSIRHGLLVGISLFFLVTVKSYALVAVLPGLVAWRVLPHFPKVKPVLVFALMYAITAMLALAVGKVLPERDVLARLTQKQLDFTTLAAGGTYVRLADLPHDTLYVPAASYAQLTFNADRKAAELVEAVDARPWRQAYEADAPAIRIPADTHLEVLLDYGKTGSAIDIPKLDGTYASVVKAAPMAVVNALFRPFPQDVNSPFMLMAALENLLLVVLILAVAFRFPYGQTIHPLMGLSLAFTLVILLLTGLVTPVVGAIVRYKVPALPFLVCSLIALIDAEKG